MDNFNSTYHHTLKLLALLILLNHLMTLKPCKAEANISVKCIASEREALVAIKQGLTDPSGRLSSWDGEDCCKWIGVSCNNETGHVNKLDLRNTYKLVNGGVGDPDAYKKSCLGGKISPAMLQLSNLAYLDLSFNDFEGAQIPEFFGELNSLQYLNLSFSSFSGEIPDQLGNLSTLQYLDLYSDSYSRTGTYELHAKSLRWLSGLSSLKYLNLGYVKLGEVGPDWLQAVNMLPSLFELNLYYCELQGLPQTLPSLNFKSISVLDLSQNSFNSEIPMWLFNLTSLTKLYLTWNFFSGPIPREFANLKSLEVLVLSNNLDLGGQIPGIFGSLRRLKILDLSANNLNGEIHEFVGSFSDNSLTTLRLGSNSLAGEVPESIGVLKNLQYLELSSNSFHGSIPGSIGKLSSLKKLDLSYNNMDGTIPDSFGKLSELVDVNLMANSWQGIVSEIHMLNLKSLQNIRITTDSTSPLVFHVPYDWVPPFSLKSIQIENCLVGPSFPKWLQIQNELTSVILRNVGISDTIPTEWFSKLAPQLTYLVLSNNQMKGKLPNQLESPYLRLVDLSSNRFEGPLPLWSTNATEVYLQDNLFSGTIPDYNAVLMPRLQNLYLSWNHLHGRIPSSLCDIDGLQILSLRSNQLSGKFPDCWHHSFMLWAIDASNNSLTGGIPRSFGLLPSLSVLQMSKNSLDGEIPSSLQNCSGLTSIDVGENKLSGVLPPWFGQKFSSLFMLRLGSNSLSGLIPQELCGLHNLHILDISSNKFSGAIPKCIDNITSLVYGNNSKVFERLVRIATRGRNPEYSNIIASVNSIDLSWNNITGGIPDEITDLLALRILNLSGNQLDGKISDRIGSLQHLETLDLSHNHLSGSIPQSLASIATLTHLNLSYNNLEGRIPAKSIVQNNFCKHPAFIDLSNNPDIFNSSHASPSERVLMILQTECLLGLVMIVVNGKALDATTRLGMSSEWI